MLTCSDSLTFARIRQRSYGHQATNELPITRRRQSSRYSYQRPPQTHRLSILEVPIRRILTDPANAQIVEVTPRVAQGCVVHRGMKTVGREPSWCWLNSEYHKALAPLFISI